MESFCTVIFSTIGKIDDVRHAVTMDVKRPDDRVYVLGMTKDELGASEYFASLGFIGNDVPKVDAASAKKLLDGSQLFNSNRFAWLKNKKSDDSYWEVY